DLRRIAGDRQRDPRRGRRAPHRAAHEPGSGLPGDAGKEMRRGVRFRLNGEAVEAQVAPHETLVEVLQESFGLYGARESCGQGLCGCCTLLVDGTAVSGCLSLASLAEGKDVTSIESGSAPDAVQEAFVERSAFQCGF